jgi:leucyl aminopeptidase
VGRAAARPPRLIEINWGDPKDPRVAIVGKGVCFDSGGLDIKTAEGMRLMKKDMGGAAHAIALARLVMQRELPIRLQMLVPAVENAISGSAYRPGDVVRTRKGLTVEVGNTDAEGRIVLCDALAYAAEGRPRTIVDFATLTGAARVALGPELPALFANDEKLAQRLLEASARVSDPMWRLPLWRNYRRLFDSDVADINNSGRAGFAGAIVGALFLDRFVPEDVAWAHLDVYAWNDASRPGRPQGGEAQGLRAVLAALS